MIFLVILNIFLCTNFDHFLSRYGHSIVPGELIVRSSNLKPERYKNILQKMLNLVPMTPVIQTKYLKSFLTSIAVFQCRKMLTWPWSLDHPKTFIFCCIILQFSSFLCFIFFFLFFSTSLKDKFNLEFLLSLKEHKY